MQSVSLISSSAAQQNKQWLTHLQQDVSTPPVKAEVNFLRLPLFALHTKGLKHLDGIECRGRIQRDQQMQQYLLRISRNTACHYPGPLSRKVHHALLSIATERGFPLQNPIKWSWRDLCRRMGIAYGGHTTVRQLKEAIRSTHGIVIHSESALFNKATGKPLPARERGYHLYSDYAFVNEPLADGTTSEENAIWFADWYVENLNAFYTAPLDYSLWQSLEQRSPTASRLYEFLLLNFYGKADKLKINYARLAKLLPVRVEQYLSDAKRQLDPALHLLRQSGMLESFLWTEAKDGNLQLHLTQGRRLAERQLGTQDSKQSDAEMSSLEVQEIRNSKSQEWFLVTGFYKSWLNQHHHQPTPKELEQARELLSEYGQSKLTLVLPLVLKKLKQQWPDAKSFTALVRYLPETVSEYDKKKKRLSREKAERVQEQKAEAVQKETQKALRSKWFPVWKELSADEQEQIRRTVLATNPRLEKVPKLLERFCLQELAKRHEHGL